MRNLIVVERRLAAAGFSSMLGYRIDSFGNMRCFVIFQVIFSNQLLSIQRFFDGRKKRTLWNLVTAKMFWARQQRPHHYCNFANKAARTLNSWESHRAETHQIRFLSSVRRQDRPPAIASFVALSIAACPHKKPKKNIVVDRNWRLRCHVVIVNQSQRLEKRSRERGLIRLHSGEAIARINQLSTKKSGQKTVAF